MLRGRFFAILCAVLAMPAQAALFDSDEYERPAPPDMAARVEALASNFATPGVAAIPTYDQLDYVNRLINSRQYVEDRANYGVADHWATAMDFDANGGDCEDFAIAKYAMLKAAGVPANAMRVVVVRDLALETQHAVLSVELGSERYILDNQAAEVLPESAVTRYRPVYALSETRWWLFLPKAG